jgi:hypothetical protein
VWEVSCSPAACSCATLRRLPRPTCQPQWRLLLVLLQVLLMLVLLQVLLVLLLVLLLLFLLLFLLLQV